MPVKAVTITSRGHAECTDVLDVKVRLVSNLESEQIAANNTLSMFDDLHVDILRVIEGHTWTCALDRSRSAQSGHPPRYHLTFTKVEMFAIMYSISSVKMIVGVPVW